MGRGLGAVPRGMGAVVEAMVEVGGRGGMASTLENVGGCGLGE